MNKDDFFNFLRQKGIRKKAKEHQNLVELLWISPRLDEIFLVGKLEIVILMMQTNEELMQALR